MIVLPGGLPGATNLDAHAGLDKLIMSFAAAGKPLAAICAAPMVYGKRGLLKGRSYLLSGLRQVPGRSRIHRKYGRSSRQLHFG